MERNQTFAVTGAGGFLGWHVKMALQAEGHAVLEIPLGDRFDPETAASSMRSADRLIHLAGVNRAADEEVTAINKQFAEQIAQLLMIPGSLVQTVTYANSIQSGNGSVYGEAKKASAELIQSSAHNAEVEFRDLQLPNLFGEHGKPFYNSVVSTFSHILATEAGEPSVQADRELLLMHAQDAADWLIGSSDYSSIDSSVYRTATVSEVLAKLRVFSRTYRKGEFPDLADDFSRDLFNTYRSFVPIQAINLKEHSDPRGSFVEMIRSWGGTGQSSFSTTHPGISRGDHFHRRKVERFVVVSGKAQISLRRMFTEEVVNFVANGQPIAVDMPTGWTHKLENVGEDVLNMFFWTNDIFDPANPDTYMEPV